jgi:hypothetical protein
MSDNTPLPGTGEVIADEDVGGVKYQRMKLVDGTPGSTTPVPISSGPVDICDPGLNVRPIPSLIPIPVAAGDESPVAIDVVPPGWDVEKQANEGTLGNDSLLGAAFDEASGVRMSVGPALSQAGQQPLSMALPVALANEQFFDRWIQGAPCGPGGLNANLLSSYPPFSPLNAALDVLQFRSLTFDIVTGAGISAGVVTFEASNSGGSVAANWIAIAAYDLAAVPSVGVTSLTLAASVTRSFAVALQHRYFRVRISTAIAGGQAVAFGRLSFEPFSAPSTQIVAAAATSKVDAAMWAGTAGPSAGVAGVVAAGGNIAPGLAQTANPLVVAGVDFGALTRRIVTDVLGQLILAGPDFRNSMNEGVNKNPLYVGLPRGDTGTENLAELLGKILSELRRMNIILLETPLALNTGQPLRDEVTDFFDDRTTLT